MRLLFFSFRFVIRPRLADPIYCRYITGGDDNAVPYYFVGYWPSKSTGEDHKLSLSLVDTYSSCVCPVVIAHEGTDPFQVRVGARSIEIPEILGQLNAQFLSLLTDATVLLGGLDSTLFPGLNTSIQVHGNIELFLTASYSIDHTSSIL